jgi:hypothetical protein
MPTMKDCIKWRSKDKEKIKVGVEKELFTSTLSLLQRLSSMAVIEIDFGNCNGLEPRTTWQL